MSWAGLVAPSTFATLALHLKPHIHSTASNKPALLLLLLQHRQNQTLSFSSSTSPYLLYFKKHTPVTSEPSVSTQLGQQSTQASISLQTLNSYTLLAPAFSPNKERRKKLHTKEQFKPNPTFWLRERVNLGRLLSCCSARFAQTNLLILPYTFTFFCCLVTWISEHGNEQV